MTIKGLSQRDNSLFELLVAHARQPARLAYIDGVTIRLESGETLLSLRQMAAWPGMTIGFVQGALKRLEAAGRLARRYIHRRYVLIVAAAPAIHGESELVRAIRGESREARPESPENSAEILTFPGACEPLSDSPIRRFGDSAIPPSSSFPLDPLITTTPDPGKRERGRGRASPSPVSRRPPVSRRSRVPARSPLFDPLPEEFRLAAVAMGVAQPEPLWDHFCDHYRMLGLALGDWLAGWRCWLRKSRAISAPAAKRGGNRRPPATSGNPFAMAEQDDAVIGFAHG